MSVHFNKTGYCDHPDGCFICNKKLSYHEGVVLWHGTNGVIGFHKNCAAEFMAHLGSDLVKLKHKVKDKNKIQLF